MAPNNSYKKNNKIALTLLLHFVTGCVYSQTIRIVPNIGFNFSSFTYPAGGKKPSSILTYPYDNYFNYNFGAEVIYEKKGIRHILSFSSMPMGISFYGDVKKQGTNETSISFALGSANRQLQIGYQLQGNLTISKTRSKRQLNFFYGAGVGIGFNRSETFYKTKQIPVIFGGTNSDGHFYAYEFNYQREKTGIYIMPETGLIFFNKKNKPVLITSLFCYLGLRDVTSGPDMTLQYGNANTTYFVEEKLYLKSKGSVFGIKIGIPIKLVSF